MRSFQGARMVTSKLFSQMRYTVMNLWYECSHPIRGGSGPDVANKLIQVRGVLLMMNRCAE